MDKHIGKIIGEIKKTMDDHAHGAMSIPASDIHKFNEMAGAYRGMQHCLDIIEGILKSDEDY